jgi:hypothetical protein
MNRKTQIIKLIWKSRNAAFLGAVALLMFGTASVGAQQLFDNPEDAVTALATATQNKDKEAIEAIFGPNIEEILSGDLVADSNAFDKFSEDLKTARKLEKKDEKTYMILVGEDEWPFAVPIVSEGAKWRFDTEAGIEEAINRRVGENELDVIRICQVYAIAQKEYFDNGDWDGDQVSEYAQKFISSEGKKDGLFWDQISEDDDESPLGPLFAYAAREGYEDLGVADDGPAPFHGYLFKILTGQGPSAPGGRFQYIINGNMIAGFGMVAYPVEWGKSGVMTFIINQEGRVYQKNLGASTGQIASAMTTYDPDATWSLSFIED